MTKDITFCLSDCEIIECIRNKMNIEHPENLHRYGFLDGTSNCIKDKIIKNRTCNKCKYLEILNNKNVYACCKKTNTIFKPFELDTRKHSCKLFGSNRE